MALSVWKPLCVDARQGYGVGGKIFPKFPTPTSQHKGNEICLKINGNRGTQQEISVSTKVSKEIVPFQQEFPI